MAVPLGILTSNKWEFLLLYIIVNIWSCQYLRFSLFKTCGPLLQFAHCGSMVVVLLGVLSLSHVWLLWLHRQEPWNSPGKNTGKGCHFLLQEIFPNQELNPGLLHCRQFLFWGGSHFLLQGIFPPQELNPGLLHCRQILYWLSYERVG